MTAEDFEEEGTLLVQFKRPLNNADFIKLIAEPLGILSFKLQENHK